MARPPGTLAAERRAALIQVYKAKFVHAKLLGWTGLKYLENPTRNDVHFVEKLIKTGVKR